MGNWGYKPDESDTFADVYDAFFDEYDNGASPEAATEIVRTELADYFEEASDQTDAYFALAYAQWSTQSLEPELLARIEQIVESGADLKNWEDSVGEPDTLEKRASALAAFLKKLKTPRKSKKRRVRPKFDFRHQTVVEIPAPDGSKEFSVIEEYTNGEYGATSAMMMWSDGGGSVFIFSKQGAKVAARWLDNQNLEVSIEKGIEFTMKDDCAYFCGDNVDITYKEI